MPLSFQAVKRFKHMLPASLLRNALEIFMTDL
jgi:hypothetical protein